MDSNSTSRRNGYGGVLACLLFLLFGASCGASYTIRLSSSDIEQAIARRLPISASKLLITATVRSVSVEFMVDEDRVLLGSRLDVAIAGQSVLSGRMLIEGQIRYTSGTGEIFLDDPTVVDVSIEGLPASVRPMAEEVVAKLALTDLAAMPLYRLNPDDFKQALTKLVLRSIKVRHGRLEIMLRAL